MVWHTVTTSDLGAVDVAGFVSDFAKQYAREVEAEIAARPDYPVRQHYLLYRREHVGTGVQTIYLPEDTMHLVRRMKNWESKVHPFNGEPNLAGAHVIPIS